MFYYVTMLKCWHWNSFNWKCGRLENVENPEVLIK